MPRIFVAGHKGMVGSAICKQLVLDTSSEIITAERNELDLLCQDSVHKFFQSKNIDHVYLAAAKVGGIHANNTYPAEFIYENLAIQSNVIHSAFQANVERLLFLGSSCIYPKLAKQPMCEEDLLTGPLEPTNEPYGIAKIAGIKMCQSYNRQYGTDFRCVMPTNLYGPGDNFHPDNSHVIPALLRRFSEAVRNEEGVVNVWGTGNVRREFMFVDDMAAASVFVLNLSESCYRNGASKTHNFINVGVGRDYSIRELTAMIIKLTDYKGEVIWDHSAPEGPQKKLMDTERLSKLGWRPNYTLKIGLRETYEWYEKHRELEIRSI
jgi:GDP-L-fucose synthase